MVDDDLGFEGAPANDRRYPNEELAGAFDWALDIAQHLDQLGYDEFWMAEHHFQPEGYECIPNLLMLSLYLATPTQRLKFGCGFNITPMWHPLRLAEDFAAPLGLMRLTPEQIEAVARPGPSRGVALPTLQEAVAGGTWLCGPAEMLVEHLKGVEEKYPGVERINVGAVMGMPRDVFKDQLTKFADEVMPAFSGKPGA